MITTPATDEDEPIDVLTHDGLPTGIVKPRAAVHRDGDWHRCVFVWIVRAGPRGPELVLQRRSPVKATWPSRFDASVAGHFRAGESRRDALREVEEELGFPVHEDDLVLQPPHAEEHHFEDGMIDREHHDVALLRRDAPLETYHPSPIEVTGLVAVPVKELAVLVRGDRDELSGLVLVTRDRNENVHMTPITLRRDDLVPYTGGYLERLCASAEELAAT
jgi:isopentenyldiphosphate isomerase